MSWCTKCGNTGYTLENEPCDCTANIPAFTEGLACIDIPEQYQGVEFNKLLIRSDIDESYKEVMEGIYRGITSYKWKHKNVLICSPVGSSKSVLAYSCIENLFRRGFKTFPIYDILELKRILGDLDNSKKAFYEVKNPEHIIEAQYLFVQIPQLLGFETFAMIATLLNRRVRRNNSTILMYNGTYEELVSRDYNNSLKNLKGDGSYNTVKEYSYTLKGES